MFLACISCLTWPEWNMSYTPSANIRTGASSILVCHMTVKSAQLSLVRYFNSKILFTLILFTFVITNYNKNSIYWSIIINLLNQYSQYSDYHYLTMPLPLTHYPSTLTHYPTTTNSLSPPPLTHYPTSTNSYPTTTNSLSPPPLTHYPHHH